MIPRFYRNGHLMTGSIFNYLPSPFSLAMGLLLVGMVAMTGSCQPKGQKTVVPMANADHQNHEPVSLTNDEQNVRVRVLANVDRVTLTSSGLLSIGQGEKDVSTYRSPVTLATGPGRVVVTAIGTRPVTLPASGFWVIPQQSHSVTVGGERGGKTYEGKIRVETAIGKYAKPNHMDVMVYLPMEAYLPGVLHAELYSNWPLETFKAQAIAARSYTYFEMGLNTGKTYDLEGTIASQAYAGAGAHDRAVDAVNMTRGIILTWEQKVLPAFYSSACGGVNQYAGLVLPHGTQAGPINSPRAACTWCKQSKYYRWGPVNRNRMTLSKRIAAWGNASDKPVAALGTLVRIDATATTPGGRPTQFTLTDATGKSFVLGAESLRFACNFEPRGMSPVSPADNLRSSHCRVTVLGNDVLFENGRGYGHGVGLCQWGSQGLAHKGYNAQSILGFYYPGSTLKKLY